MWCPSRFPPRGPCCLLLALPCLAFVAVIASRVGSSPANPLCLSCTNEKSKARHIKPHVKSSSVYLHRSIDRSIIIPGAPVQRSEAGQLHALSSSLHSDLSNILSGSRAGRYTTPSKQRATNQVNSLKEHAWPPRVYSHCDHYLWQRGRCKKKNKVESEPGSNPKPVPQTRIWEMRQNQKLIQRRTCPGICLAECCAFSHLQREESGRAWSWT